MYPDPYHPLGNERITQVRRILDACESYGDPDLDRHRPPHHGFDRAAALRGAAAILIEESEASRAWAEPRKKPSA